MLPSSCKAEEEGNYGVYTALNNLNTRRRPHCCFSLSLLEAAEDEAAVAAAAAAAAAAVSADATDAADAADAAAAGAAASAAAAADADVCSWRPQPLLFPSIIFAS